MEEISWGRTNWSVLSAPVAGSASKVFPGVAPEKQNAKLWDVLFEICRIEERDPVAAWQKHTDALAKRSEYLNGRRFAALRLTGPGTDLTVGLTEAHVWKTGRLSTAAGIPFTANIPTEEIFTIPHRELTEGVVTATKPLSFGGGLVERFEVSFSGGRVTHLSAGAGEESLRQLVGTDEGACRLGEVALVPHNTPISQSGLVFHNTLIDENASSHLALGHAYQFNLRGGETMSQEEFSAAGGNSSRSHVDFMIGSAEVDVDGVRYGGGTEPVMRKGEWAFDP